MAYQLLIVDDEPLAIKGIEAGVRWDKVGIDRVFTARNIRQAKEIFNTQAIDLMLCDIEMPQGNGLELLAWVRQNHPVVESVILTCHADFEYARKALQLGSLDYVLKDMTYADLENILEKAIKKIEKDRQLLKYSQFGELWQKNQPLMLEQFWLDIANGNIAGSDVAGGDVADADAAISQEARERGMDFPTDILVLPMLIYLAPLTNQALESLEKVVLLEIRKQINTQEHNKIQGRIIKQDKGIYLCLVQPDPATPNNRQELAAWCRTLSRHIQASCACDLFFYIGSETLASGLAQMVRELLDLKRNDVIRKDRALLLGATAIQTTPIQSIDLNVWSSMIAEKAYGQFIQEVTAYMESRAQSGEINSQILQQFHQDFLQMIYSLLKQKKLQAHLLLSDVVSIGLFDQATRSIADMLVWIRHVIARIQEDSLSNEDSLSVIEKIKRYISLHLADFPSREDLANYVFLNPDYLTRLFKKETGMTLTAYSQNLRIQYAKDLLAKTDISVSKIAAQVGYSNFSHFTRAFKEITGISPTEYKNSCKKQEE